MTDGTSQGLFVVVAVVIFGIFVAIAYTLFEDNLRPSLASIFSVSMEQASRSLTKNLLNSKSIFTNVDFLTPFSYSGGTYTATYVSNSSNTNNTNKLVSIWTDGFLLVDGTTYTLSGNLFLNGKPVGENQWTYKGNNNYKSNEILSFKVDDVTGYFEIVFVQNSVKSGDNRRVLHNVFLDENNKTVQVGDEISFSNFVLKSND